MLMSCAFILACGDDDSDDSSGVTSGPSATNFGGDLIETDSQIMGLALNVLSSSTVSSVTTLALQSDVSSVYEGCSENGEPWDDDTNNRMAPDNDEFGKQTFYCQLKSDESPDTVRGSFARNYNILCSIEEAIGGQLTYDGTSQDVTIFPTTDCGWSEGSVDEAPATGYETTITSSTLTEGEWDRLIHITLPAGDMSFKIYIANDEESIAFKAVDDWTHDPEGNSNDALGDDEATGKSGGVIALNFVEGVLRGEIIDTYWGRRARIFAEGTIDAETAEFTDITKMEGLQGNFGISIHEGQTGSYIELASAKGTKADGFKFNSVRMMCHESNSCDPTQEINQAEIDSSGTECYPSTASCSGNDGIALGTEDEDFAFWMFGADMDDQEGSRSTVETWLEDAGVPTFSSVTKAVTID